MDWAAVLKGWQMIVALLPFKLRRPAHKLEYEPIAFEIGNRIYAIFTKAPMNAQFAELEFSFFIALPQSLFDLPPITVQAPWPKYNLELGCSWNPSRAFLSVFYAIV